MMHNNKEHFKKKTNPAGPQHHLKSNQQNNFKEQKDQFDILSAQTDNCF